MGAVGVSWAGLGQGWWAGILEIPVPPVGGCPHGSMYPQSGYLGLSSTQRCRVNPHAGYTRAFWYGQIPCYLASQPSIALLLFQGDISIPLSPAEQVTSHSPHTACPGPSSEAPLHPRVRAAPAAGCKGGTCGEARLASSSAFPWALLYQTFLPRGACGLFSSRELPWGRAILQHPRTAGGDPGHRWGDWGRLELSIMYFSLPTFQRGNALKTQVIWEQEEVVRRQICEGLCLFLSSFSGSIPTR